MINHNKEHYMSHYLTKNRNIRNRKQNKVGHHDQMIGRSKYTQQTFLYKSIEIYNKIPRKITLIRNLKTFKTWLKKYKMNENIKLKEQKDNEEVDLTYEANPISIRKCQDLYEDIII